MHENELFMHEIFMQQFFMHENYLAGAFSKPIAYIFYRRIYFFHIFPAFSMNNEYFNRTCRAEDKLQNNEELHDIMNI